MAKPRCAATDGRDAEATGAPRAGWRGSVLDASLRLLHPFMPFVTEEIWQALPHEGELLAHRGLAARQDARGSTPRPSSRWRSSRSWWWRCATCGSRSDLPPGKRVPVVVRGERAARPRPARSRTRSSRWPGSDAHARARRLAAAGRRLGGRARRRDLPAARRADRPRRGASAARRARRTSCSADLEGTKKKLATRTSSPRPRPEVVEKERQRLPGSRRRSRSCSARRRA